MSALYRQYRPQLFSEVAGQEHVTDTLQQAVTSGRVAHAYLFHGPRGTGKTTVARILARRLNCQQPSAGEPCGTCATCTAAREQRLLDVIEIDAASNRGIDDIRALKESVGLKPSLGTYKVYIIDEVHMLTHEAFTALLKTLEEPAAKVVFVLASTEFHKIPETIISRCQVFHFRRASAESLRTRLHYILAQEKREVEPAALEFIGQRSDGCYRDAESLLGQVLTLHDGTITYDHVVSFLGLPPQALLEQFLGALVRSESAPALGAVDEAVRLGFDVEQFLAESIRLARTQALAALKEAPATTSWPAIIRALVQAMQDIAYVPEPTIALHIVIVSLCTKRGNQELPHFATIRPRAHGRGEASRGEGIKNTASERATSEPKQPTKQNLPATNYQLQTIVSLWPGLIDAVKKENPVASTFLRALRPISYSDGVVVIEARYALHRTFFDKPDNLELLTETLSRLSGTPLRVRFVLQENSNAPLNNRATQEQEQALISAVKDVFGR